MKRERPSRQWDSAGMLTIQERNTALVFEETIMVSDPKNPPSAREILLLGPYGVLGTGVVDAAAANPAWRVVTAARRPVPAHRDSTAVRHINVDLLDREGTTEVISKLNSVTDLVFAAYV